MVDDANHAAIAALSQPLGRPGLLGRDSHSQKGLDGSASRVRAIMEVVPPSGYLSLRAARDILMQRMHKGIPPSENIKTCRNDGVDIVDATQAAASANVLREAIRGSDLALFALFSSRDTPMRLHNLALIEAALFPSNSTVLTFAYCARHSRAPFGLSWSDLKELTRDPLCLDEKCFGRWLRNQERKKEWPCHEFGGETRRPPGRPSRVIDDAIEAIEELNAKGELTPSTPSKVVHALLQSARPSLRNVSEETVRRARKQASYRVP
jgi:hypothetical protein